MLEVMTSTVAITGAVTNPGGPGFPCGTVFWALQCILGAVRNSWIVCLQEPGERSLVCSEWHTASLGVSRAFHRGWTQMAGRDQISVSYRQLGLNLLPFETLLRECGRLNGVL